jgi:hypothetical protein
MRALPRFPRDQGLLRDRLVKVLYGEAGILYFLAELNELGAATLERRPSAQEFNKLGPIDCLSAVA